MAARKKGTMGERVREARDAVGVPAENLDRAARLPAGTVEAIEAGGEAPDKALEAIAAELGRGLDELTRGPLAAQSPGTVHEAKLRIQRSQGGRTATISDPVERLNVANNLRIRRTSAGMSQRQVAELIGIAISNVNHHENPDAPRAPGMDSLQKYAELYRCVVPDLLSPPPEIVFRAKVSDRIQELSDEDRADIERTIREVEERMNRTILEALAKGKKRRR